MLELLALSIGFRIVTLRSNQCHQNHQCEESSKCSTSFPRFLYISTVLNISTFASVDDSGDDMLAIALIAVRRFGDLAIVIVQKGCGI